MNTPPPPPNPPHQIHSEKGRNYLYHGDFPSEIKEESPSVEYGDKNTPSVQSQSSSK